MAPLFSLKRLGWCLGWEAHSSLCIAGRRGQYFLGAHFWERHGGEQRFITWLEDHQSVNQVNKPRPALIYLGWCRAPHSSWRCSRCLGERALLCKARLTLGKRQSRAPWKVAVPCLGIAPGVQSCCRSAWLQAGSEVTQTAHTVSAAHADPSQHTLFRWWWSRIYSAMGTSLQRCFVQSRQIDRLPS